MGEKSTKILYIITKSVWAGASKYVYDMATGLPQARLGAMVAAGGRGIMAEKIISAGIPYYEIKGFQRDVNALKDIFAFFEILSLLFKTKPDVVHVSSAKAGGIAGMAAFVYKLLTLNFKLLTIFTAHGWTFHENRPKWQIALIKFFSKLTCIFYDKVICVSKYDYESAIKNKICSRRKLAVIHNGIKPKDYKFYERTEKKFTVGTIGEATKNKGHKYLMEAAKNFPGINFNIISDMPDAARRLKNFDIFVLPSLKEGLPYVLLEAGLAEIPIVATNVGGVPEIIENNKTPNQSAEADATGQAGLLVSPADADELANAIKKLIENPDLRNELARNARQKILQEFSFEKMLRETLSAYENKSNAGENSKS